MTLAKRIGKKILPASWILFYHSVRVSSKLGILGALLRTLPNATRKVRLGDEGAWTIPSVALNHASICYCIGCGEDISFDMELIRKYSCNVFAFDPTPQAIAYVTRHASHIPNYRFSEFAIWDKEETVRFYVPSHPLGVSHSITNFHGTDRYLEVKAKRLKQVLESNHHASISLLKMDIEGAEHTVIKTIVEDDLHIDVLCVEFDDLGRPAPTPDQLTTTMRSIQSLLDSGYRYFWIDGSNFTFVRRSG